MIIMRCDWCEVEKPVESDADKAAVRENLGSGEPFRCESCQHKWDDMQAELRRKVSEYRNKLISEAMEEMRAARQQIDYPHTHLHH